MKRVTKKDLKYISEINAFARICYYSSGQWIIKYANSKSHFLSILLSLSDIGTRDVEITFNPNYKLH